MSSSGVVLVGPRGAGKSTVAPLLAARLGLPSLDADREMEREHGRPLTELFAASDFRARERRTLERLLAGPPAVVAAGGGAVLWEGFAAAARGWTVVWLDAPPGMLAERIAADPAVRPSLTGKAPEREIAAVAREREPLYRAAARHRIDTKGVDPAAIGERIAKLLARDA